MSLPNPSDAFRILSDLTIHCQSEIENHTTKEINSPDEKVDQNDQFLLFLRSKGLEIS